MAWIQNIKRKLLTTEYDTANDCGQNTYSFQISHGQILPRQKIEMWIFDFDEKIKKLFQECFCRICFDCYIEIKFTTMIWSFIIVIQKPRQGLVAID